MFVNVLTFFKYNKDFLVQYCLQNIKPLISLSTFSYKYCVVNTASTTYINIRSPNSWIRSHNSQGRCGCDRMVVGFTTTYMCMQSVPITTNVVSSNPAQARCTRYSITFSQ